MIPRIRQADGQIGFYWVSGDGRPVTLAERLTGLETELRAGQIVGTSALLAIRARMALGTDGPGPFAGMLSEPRAGVHAGHGQFHWTDPDVPADPRHAAARQRGGEGRRPRRAPRGAARDVSVGRC